MVARRHSGMLRHGPVVTQDTDVRVLAADAVDLDVEEVGPADEVRHEHRRGVPVDLRFWTVLWFAESKITRRQVFWTRDQALEAAGLSE